MSESVGSSTNLKWLHNLQLQTDSAQLLFHLLTVYIFSFMSINSCNPVIVLTLTPFASSRSNPLPIYGETDLSFMNKYLVLVGWFHFHFVHILVLKRILKTRIWSVAIGSNVLFFFPLTNTNVETISFVRQFLNQHNIDSDGLCIYLGTIFFSHKGKV